MAVILDATISGQLSNSFCDQDYADDYWDNHYSPTKAALWQALSDDQKGQLLVQACKVIDGIRFTLPLDPLMFDSEMHWDRASGKVIQYVNSRNPYKYTIIQNLQFPRNLDYLQDGTVYIPEDIKMAQCEQAVALLTANESAISTKLAGIKRESFSVGNGAYAEATSYETGGTGSLLAPMAMEFVKPYVLKSGNKNRRA